MSEIRRESKTQKRPDPVRDRGVNYDVIMQADMAEAVDLCTWYMVRMGLDLPDEPVRFETADEAFRRLGVSQEEIDDALADPLLRRMTKLADDLEDATGPEEIAAAISKLGD